MPSYVSAPPTTVDALLTQSGARQGLILLEAGKPLQPLLRKHRVQGYGESGGLFASKISGKRSEICFFHIVLANYYEIVRHFVSPDRWLRSDTSIPQLLFQTCKKGRFHWRKLRICNAKINCLTGFSA